MGRGGLVSMESPLVVGDTKELPALVTVSLPDEARGVETVELGVEVLVGVVLVLVGMGSLRCFGGRPRLRFTGG